MMVHEPNMKPIVRPTPVPIMAPILIYENQTHKTVSSHNPRVGESVDDRRNRSRGTFSLQFDSRVPKTYIERTHFTKKESEPRMCGQSFLVAQEPNSELAYFSAM